MSRIHTISMMVALLLPVFTLAENWKSPRFKSLATAQQECADVLRLSNETLDRYVRSGYADEQATQNLLHCTLVNIFAWNDTTGVKDYVFKYFFQPSALDTCYENRTQDCLRTNVDPLPQSDTIGRAAKSFRCYYRNYGDVVSAPQFLPNSEDVVRKEYKTSIAIANVPRCVLEQFAAGNILDTPEFAEVYYIYAVRNGCYDPAVGFLYQHVYVEFGDPGLFNEQNYCCENTIRQRYTEEPTRFIQTYKQCLIKYIPILSMVQDVARELIGTSSAAPVPAPSCSSCGAPAPCAVCNYPTLPPPLPAPISYPCSNCGAPAPCNKCNVSTPAPQASYSPCSSCGGPAPCNTCNVATPAPSPPSCSSCGAPSPCLTCNNSLVRYSYNAPRPCYNGQCY